MLLKKNLPPSGNWQLGDQLISGSLAFQKKIPQLQLDQGFHLIDTGYIPIIFNDVSAISLEGDMQCSSWQEICDQGVTYVRDACNRACSDDDRWQLASFREYGLDPDEGEHVFGTSGTKGGGNGYLRLGTYRSNGLSNEIELHLDVIASCCRAIEDELLVKGWSIADQERQTLATLSVMKTLFHEQFHHLSDIFRRLAKPPKGFDRLTEEALAVSWSYLQLEATQLKMQCDRKLFDVVVDSWFSGYTAPGYNEWERYVHSHVFLAETAQYLMGAEGIEQENWVRRLPLMQSETNPYVNIALHYCQKQSQDTFSPSGPGLASTLGWDVDKSAVFKGSGIHECGTTSTELPDLGKYRGQGYKYICVKESPAIVNVLRLLSVNGVNRVYADENEWLEIINKYLPTNDIIEAQEDLIERGLKKYARMKKPTET
jgi:hypothetical protein